MAGLCRGSELVAFLLWFFNFRKIFRFNYSVFLDFEFWFGRYIQIKSFMQYFSLYFSFPVYSYNCYIAWSWKTDHVCLHLSSINIFQIWLFTLPLILRMSPRTVSIWGGYSWVGGSTQPGYRDRQRMIWNCQPRRQCRPAACLLSTTIHLFDKCSLSLPSSRYGKFTKKPSVA